jgi:hypothetical protein
MAADKPKFNYQHANDSDLKFLEDAIANAPFRLPDDNSYDVSRFNQAGDHLDYISIHPTQPNPVSIAIDANNKSGRVSANSLCFEVQSGNLIYRCFYKPQKIIDLEC